MMPIRVIANFALLASGIWLLSIVAAVVSSLASMFKFNLYIFTHDISDL
jgi:hypothetical protein